MSGIRSARFLLIAALGLAAPPMVLAQEVFKGIGGGFCSEFLKARDLPEMEVALSSWTYGFYTASNLLFFSESDQTMRDLSGPELQPAALMEYVTNGCQADPTKEVLSILAPLYAGLPFHELKQ